MQYLIRKPLVVTKDEIRDLSCGSTLGICQCILKIAYLLHKQGFVDSQMVTTVSKYLYQQLSFSSHRCGRVFDAAAFSVLDKKNRKTIKNIKILYP